MLTGITVLIVILLLAIAWGIRGIFGIPGVPTGKRWLIVFLGRRLNWSFGEGMCWLPRWLCTYIEYDCLEDEFHVIADDIEGVPSRENIMLRDGIEAIIRNVSIYYEVGHESGPVTGWKRILRLIGWNYDTVLYRYSQIRSEDLRNRLPKITLEALRIHVRTFTGPELLGISLEARDLAPQNRAQMNAVRAEIGDLLTQYVKPQGVEWGVNIKRVVVGDIDPNAKMLASIEAKAAALFDMQVVMVKMNAQVERAMIVLRSGGNEKPTTDEIMNIIERLTVLDNQRIAAQTGGNFGRLAQNLVGLTENALS